MILLNLDNFPIEKNLAPGKMYLGRSAKHDWCRMALCGNISPDGSVAVQLLDFGEIEIVPGNSLFIYSIWTVNFSYVLRVSDSTEELKWLFLIAWFIELIMQGTHCATWWSCHRYWHVFRGRRPACGWAECHRLRYSLSRRKRRRDCAKWHHPRRVWWCASARSSSWLERRSLNSTSDWRTRN